MKKNKKKSKNVKTEIESAVHPLGISDEIQETVKLATLEAAKEWALLDEPAPEQIPEEVPQDAMTEEAMHAEGLAELAEEEAGEEKLPQNLEIVQVRSIIESVLLAYDKPVNMSLLKEVFRGTGTTTELIKRALSDLMVEYSGAERGITVAEVSGGYQLRTKSENQAFVRRLTKGRPFKLSGPSLEVLSIVAYKQPIIKSEIDSIRGVESGHLVRALMDRSLVKFVGKSELPGKPMLYGTTRKFLEIFGLRDLRELPSLSEIDELLPEGMLEEETKEADGDKWGTVQEMSLNYQQDHQKEEEWEKITEEISKIETTTNFFEEEKKREKGRRDQERAETIREAILNGSEVSPKDKKWLERYEAQLAEAMNPTPGETAL